MNESLDHSIIDHVKNSWEWIAALGGSISLWIAGGKWQFKRMIAKQDELETTTVKKDQFDDTVMLLREDIRKQSETTEKVFEKVDQIKDHLLNKK